MRGDQDRTDTYLKETATRKVQGTKSTSRDSDKDQDKDENAEVRKYVLTPVSEIQSCLSQLMDKVVSVQNKASDMSEKLSPVLLHRDAGIGDGITSSEDCAIKGSCPLAHQLFVLLYELNCASDQLDSLQERIQL